MAQSLLSEVVVQISTRSRHDPLAQILDRAYQGGKPLVLDHSNEVGATLDTVRCNFTV